MLREALYKWTNTIQYNAVQYNAIKYNAVQYNAIQYNALQYMNLQSKLMIHSRSLVNTIQYTEE